MRRSDYDATGDGASGREFARVNGFPQYLISGERRESGRWCGRESSSGDGGGDAGGGGGVVVVRVR